MMDKYLFTSEIVDSVEFIVPLCYGDTDNEEEVFAIGKEYMSRYIKEFKQPKGKHLVVANNTRMLIFPGNSHYASDY